MNYPIKHSHAERVSLSEALMASLQDTYKSDLLAVALFGSMSRGEDKDYSDVDMIAIVKGEKIADELYGIRNGLSYGIDIFSQDVVHGKITAIHSRWPLLVGKFATAKPLIDEQHLFDAYAQLYKDTIRQDFKPYIRQIFMEEIYGECNKLISTTHFGTREQVLYISHRFFTKMVLFLGVINKTYYLNSANFPAVAMNLPINFPSLKLLGKSITSDACLSTSELRSVAQNMLNEIVQYLASESIEFED
jgi:kanamycin nucleotidyltransferase